MSVALTPIQDLHGYDHPWAGGAGKNKLAPSSENTKTLNDITIQNDKNGRYDISGTASAGTVIDFVLTDSYEIKSGDYIHFMNSATNSNASFSLYGDGETSIFSAVFSDVNRIMDLSTHAGGVVKKIRFYFGANQSLTGSVTPMIVNSATATTFAPYSNICPISGRTETSAKSVGKNQLPQPVAGTYTSTGSGTCQAVVDDEGKISISGTATSIGNIIIPLKSNIIVPVGKVYYIQLHNTNVITTITVSFEDENNDSYAAPSFSDVNRIYTPNAPSTSKTIKRMRIYISNGASLSGSFAAMFTISNIATAYEPYKSSSATLSFGQTVYGGDQDFISGSGEEEWANIASYNGETLPGEWLSSLDAYAAGTTPTTGAQVVYKTATPTELSFTAAELDMLKGYNNITGDGVITITAYTGDPWPIEEG